MLNQGPGGFRSRCRPEGSEGGASKARLTKKGTCQGTELRVSPQLEEAKGFQPYYESGFPHGKDQFISIAASSWAVRALIQTLPTTLEK